MKIPHAALLLAAGLAVTWGIPSASAQDAPPPAPPPAAAEATCGGLLCDMGLFHASRSHPIDEGLPCGVFCQAFGGRPAEPPPPPPEPIVAPAPVAAPVPAHHVRRKRAAKTAHAVVAAPAEAPAKPN